MQGSARRVYEFNKRCVVLVLDRFEVPARPAVEVLLRPDPARVVDARRRGPDGHDAVERKPPRVEVQHQVREEPQVHPREARAGVGASRRGLERGLARSGRTRRDIEIICPTLTVTADGEAEFERVKLAARKHLAFYGSTPAYRPTLECHGWEALHDELNRLSKQGRWDHMTGLVDDEVLETIAVVGPRDEIAGRLRARLEGIADGVSLTHNRAPDPANWADVVADLRRAEA